MSIYFQFIEPNNTSNTQTAEQKTTTPENLDPLSFLWPRPKQLIRKPGKMFKAKEELPIYVSAKPGRAMVQYICSVGAKYYGDRKVFRMISSLFRLAIIILVSLLKMWLGGGSRPM